MDQQETPSQSAESSTSVAQAIVMEDDSLQQQKQKKEQDELMERRKLAVKSSWRAVRLGLDVEATNIFYTRLFEKYPSVRPLFKDDMNAQYKKLFQAVCLVVDGMDNLDTLVPVLHALGKAHAGFGTVRAHYGAVTECFLWMLNSILEKMPSLSEVTDAWEWALTLIGGIMADGGDEAIEESRQRTLAEQNDIDEKKEEYWVNGT